MPINSFRDLAVWQQSMDVTRRVYVATDSLPWPHKREIGSQMRRSSLSAPSNIAEGFRQGSFRAYLRHLRVAAGSMAELETQAQLATDLELWTADCGDEIQAMADRSGRMLTGLMASLQRRLDAEEQRVTRLRPR